MTDSGHMLEVDDAGLLSPGVSVDALDDSTYSTASTRRGGGKFVSFARKSTADSTCEGLQGDIRNSFSGGISRSNSDDNEGEASGGVSPLSTSNRSQSRRRLNLHLHFHVPTRSAASTPKVGSRSGASTPKIGLPKMGRHHSGTSTPTAGANATNNRHSHRLLDYLHQHLSPGDHNTSGKTEGGDVAEEATRHTQSVDVIERDDPSSAPRDEKAPASDAVDNDDGPPPLRQTSRYIAKHVVDSRGRANYAVKRIHSEIVESYFSRDEEASSGDSVSGDAEAKDPKAKAVERMKFLQAAMDMATETYFLSVLRTHPHILTIRAVGQGDMFSPDYFLVLDRLYDTLGDKIDRDWKTTNEALEHNMLVWHRGKKKKDLLRERLSAARDMADALAYMHELNIIYRDVKPENCGFDCQGIVKLFDFGLAKETSEEKETASGSGAYKLTPNTGSFRYMAPEVGNGYPYNHAADSYSFGILLWEVLSLQCPYSNYSHDEIRNMVIKWGERPRIPEDWPLKLKELMQQCWESNFRKRPTMRAIVERLEKEVNQLDHA